MANFDTDATYAKSEEAIEVCYRMVDLIDAVLALQPLDISFVGGLSKGLWEGGHNDRHSFLTNLRALIDATA